MSDDRYIHTFSGRTVWPLDPKPDDIDIFDIAHGLALNNRYNGHTPEPYSVAQHSVLGSHLVPEMNALEFLLHDAPETYLHDIVRPIKNSVQVDGQPYDRAEDRLEACIFHKYGVPYPYSDVVRDMDNRMLVTEMRDLFNLDTRAKYKAEWLPEPIIPWHWRIARQRFIDRFLQLTQTT